MNNTWTQLPWVALGSALGGLARFHVGGWVTRLSASAFPWGTLAVNVSGGLAAGMAWALLADTGPRALEALLLSGLLGGYTTVSSFSLQTLTLLRQGHPVQALGNLTASALLCLGAAALGYWLAGLGIPA
ncbi:CrcB family protein [Ectothiorhodospira mobilis]|mgnify:CR=1 FL=1|uniref:CrcB family protein n=1 Tax=Ectothiorhodospira mobilis TaxID=195064 RepID=UPI001EE9955C|nr:CrcB family protein [Ectothiorhodospira mobilis]MCG5534707.1 CrcB family protein [Ectothiorhodospira mobilis]